MGKRTIYLYVQYYTGEFNSASAGLNNLKKGCRIAAITVLTKQSSATPQI